MSLGAQASRLLEAAKMAALPGIRAVVSVGLEADADESNDTLKKRGGKKKPTQCGECEFEGHSRAWSKHKLETGRAKAA
jgi:hypothetical protein